MPSELAERIVQLVEEDPSRSTADIAGLVGKTRGRVHQILDQLGYVYESKSAWRKPEPA